MTGAAPMQTMGEASVSPVRFLGRATMAQPGDRMRVPPVLRTATRSRHIDETTAATAPPHRLLPHHAFVYFAIAKFRFRLLSYLVLI
jgi:hypothetical protein